MIERSFALCAAVIAASGCGVESANAPAKLPVEQSISGSHATATLRLSEGTVRPGTEIEVSVELKIAPRWEVHTLGAQTGETATKLEFTTPPGIRAEREWVEPKTTRSMGTRGQPVYMGKVVFTRTLSVEPAAVGTHEISCKVTYQACNERQCLKPETLALSVPVEVRK